MKNILLLALLALIISCEEDPETDASTEVSDLQNNIDVAPVLQIQSIEDIQNAYSYIVSEIGQMDSSYFKYNCNEEKKGRVTYYSKDGELRMIIHTYNEHSHFAATDQYFINNDSIFFVFYDRMTWSFSGPPNETRDDFTEKRFYLIDNKLVKCLEKEFTNLSATSDSLTSEEVPNKEVDCSSPKPLLEEYQKLLSYKDQKADIDCLSK